MNDQQREEEIQAKGLNAPRLNPSLIQDTIVSQQYHVFEGTLLTVCCLTLRNGFTVSGESACASPKNFDAAIGEKIAYDNAVEKIWALEGYLLKQHLYEDALLTPKQRVVKERDELTVRTDALTEMLLKGKPKYISEEHWELLNRQKVQMEDLLKTLYIRLRIW